MKLKLVNIILKISSVPVTFVPTGFEPGPFGKLPDDADDANHYVIQPPPPDRLHHVLRCSLLMTFPAGASAAYC